MKKIAVVSATFLCCLLIGGCANNRLEVSVELIDPKVDGNELDRGIEDLRVLDLVVATAVGQLKKLDDGIVGEEYVGLRNNLTDEGATLRKNIQAKILDYHKEDKNLIVEVWSLPGDVIEFTEKAKGFIWSYDAPHEYEAVFGESLEIISAMAAKALGIGNVMSARSDKGFGGFVDQSTYELSPSDPMYKAVLRGKAVGSPITHVSANAVSQSTIMFVQETPGQWRKQGLDMDATQLVQNVMFITDKALTAAMTYLGVPIPASGKDPEDVARSEAAGEAEAQDAEGADDGEGEAEDPGIRLLSWFNEDPESKDEKIAMIEEWIPDDAGYDWFELLYNRNYRAQREVFLAHLIAGQHIEE